MLIESVMPSNHLILCYPLLLPSSIFPASGSFPMSQFFESGGQSIGVSASESVLPMNIQGLFLLGLTGLISLQSKGLKSLLQHHSWKALVLWGSAFFVVQFSHPYRTTGKTIALTLWIFVGKVMSLLFNMLSRLLSCVQLYANPWTVACQAPLSMEFSRQEYWSGLPFPFPGDLLDPGIKPKSPTMQVYSLPLSHLRSLN